MNDLSQDEIDYARIEKAIEFLNTRAEEQPGLERIAAHVGLSPYHFQRLFSRWAGVSPKQFLSALTINNAKQILEDNTATLLDAAYGSGLSSTGRLHDLFIKLEGMTPGEYKNLGSDVEIRYGFHPTPFGRAIVCVTERGLCGLSFTGPEQETGVLEYQKQRWPLSSFHHDTEKTAAYIELIFQTGTERTRDRRVDCLLKGSPFQLKVWEALLTIQPGCVSTYGEIAAAVGKPAAARAAANAVGANPVAYLIPCLRGDRGLPLGTGAETGDAGQGIGQRGGLTASTNSRREPRSEPGDGRRRDRPRGLLRLQTRNRS